MAVACVSVNALAQDREDPPNIIMIVGDDHGWFYSGFMGDEIVQTPTLDQLAEEGTVFTHGYSTASVCRPALRTLLSGMHPRVWDHHIDEIKRQSGLNFGSYQEIQFIQTLPRRLSEAGYTSFEAGKYWEGTFDRAGFDAGMADTWVGGFSQDGDDFGRPSTQELWDFLDGDDEPPFFLWLAPMLPHTPLDPGPEFTQLYQEQGLVNTAVLYYANISRLDALIEEVLGQLANRGLDENTLIVYVSDNGLEQDPYQEHTWGFILGGDRGKISMYELGFRSPILFHWPGRIPAGQRFADLVSFEDIYSTLLDYGGVPPGSKDTGRTLRGRIEGRQQTPVRDRIFGMMDQVRARPEEHVTGSGMASLITDERAGFARTQDWRFVHFIDRGERELYRIEEDPLEQINLVDDHPELARRLEEDLANWIEQGYLVPEPSASTLAVAALLSLCWLARLQTASPDIHSRP